LPDRQWGLVECGAGLVEIVGGVGACTGAFPFGVGLLLLLQGSAFVVVLATVRARHLSGGCGCVRRGNVSTRQQVTMRSFLGAGFVLVSGAIELSAPGGNFSVWLFLVGLSCGTALLVVAYADELPRSPRCHRRLWRGADDLLYRLTHSPVFASVEKSFGPLGSPIGHQRDACAEKFYFRGGSSASESARLVAFYVSLSETERLRVKVSLWKDAEPAGAGQRSRVLESWAKEPV
jgi:hypothetical protein